MTEAEWLACTDPQAMLQFLRSKASDRKVRLFAVACCRRVWSSLEHEEFRDAVRKAESFADDLVDRVEMLEAHETAARGLRHTARQRQRPWRRANRFRLPEPAEVLPAQGRR